MSKKNIYAIFTLPLHKDIIFDRADLYHDKKKALQEMNILIDICNHSEYRKKGSTKAKSILFGKIKIIKKEKIIPINPNK